MKYLLQGLVFIGISLNLIAQDNLKPQYDLGMKVLKTIELKDINGFKDYIFPEVLSTIDNDVIIKFINQGSDFIKEHGYPDSDKLLISPSKYNYNGKMVDLFTINFPFPNLVKRTDFPQKSIALTFAPEITTKQIVGFRTHDYRLTKLTDIDSKDKIPHKSSLDFDDDYITWFRIYYDRGITQNNIGNENGVFAVSGDKRLLKDLNIEQDIQQIFGLLKEAKVDKTDYNNQLTRTNGDAEFIYFRFKLDNSKYPDLDELTIYVLLKEEKGIKEDNREYIIVKHSDINRYFIKAIEHKDLYLKLKEFVIKDYKGNLELRP